MVSRPTINFHSFQTALPLYLNSPDIQTETIHNTYNMQKILSNPLSANCTPTIPSAPSKPIGAMVPLGSFYAIMTNFSVSSMEVCCRPNRVRTHSQTCQFWCQVPNTYNHILDGINNDFWDCLIYQEPEGKGGQTLETGQNVALSLSFKIKPSIQLLYIYLTFIISFIFL